MLTLDALTKRAALSAIVGTACSWFLPWRGALLVALLLLYVLLVLRAEVKVPTWPR